MDVGQVTTIKEILRRRPGGVENLPITSMVSVRAGDIRADEMCSINLVEEEQCDVLLALMGADTKSFGRERRQASKKLVGEI